MCPAFSKSLAPALLLSPFPPSARAIVYRYKAWVHFVDFTAGVCPNRSPQTPPNGPGIVVQVRYRRYSPPATAFDLCLSLPPKTTPSLSRKKYGVSPVTQPKGQDSMQAQRQGYRESSVRERLWGSARGFIVVSKKARLIEIFQ